MRVIDMNEICFSCFIVASLTLKQFCMIAVVVNERPRAVNANAIFPESKNYPRILAVAEK